MIVWFYLHLSSFRSGLCWSCNWQRTNSYVGGFQIRLSTSFGNWSCSFVYICRYESLRLAALISAFHMQKMLVISPSLSLSVESVVDSRHWSSLADCLGGTTQRYPRRLHVAKCVCGLQRWVVSDTNPEQIRLLTAIQVAEWPSDKWRSGLTCRSICKCRVEVPKGEVDGKQERLPFKTIDKSQDHKRLISLFGVNWIEY